MKKVLKRAAIAAGAVLLVLGGLWLFLAFQLGALSPNAAEEQTKPVRAEIEALGGSFICSSGDNGKGISNTVPWETSYFEISDSPTLSEDVKRILRQDGYELKTDSMKVDRIKSGFNITGTGEYSERNEYYLVEVPKKGDYEVEIVRAGESLLHCSEDTFAEGYPVQRSMAPAPNKAILYMSFADLSYQE